MIYLSEDILSLSRLIAVLILILAFIYALFETRRTPRLIISILLVLITLMHYIILLHVSSYVEIYFYPLVIVESTSNGSVFYVDFGQLSVILLIALWRDKAKLLINKFRRGCRIEGEHGGSTEGS
ncbi:MAG: hypothetical protein QXE10_00990 [Desulfurococcaceae archaeon]